MLHLLLVLGSQMLAMFMYLSLLTSLVFLRLDNDMWSDQESMDKVYGGCQLLSLPQRKHEVCVHSSNYAMYMVMHS